MKKKAVSSAKKAEASVRKSNSKAKQTKQEKKAKKAEVAEKPTLQSILDKADRAFTDVVKNYMLLGEALVEAITYYGAEGKRAFRTRYPLTDNALRNLEEVGRGNLLPHFAMCSDRFVKGLLDMVDSLDWQSKLVGATKGGFIRIRLNGKLIDAKLEDLKSPKLVDGVLSVISDADENLGPDELCKKLQELGREVRSKFNHKDRPLFDIRESNGVKVVRFYKSRPYTVGDLKGIIAKMEEEA